METSTNNTAPVLLSVNTNYLNAVLNLTKEGCRPLLEGSIRLLDLLSQALKEMSSLIDMAKPLGEIDSWIEMDFTDVLLNQDSDMNKIIASVGCAVGSLTTRRLIENNL